LFGKKYLLKESRLTCVPEDSKVVWRDTSIC